MKGSFSFIVRGDNLDFDGISTKLHLLPTSTIKKGQPVRIGGSSIALYDLWKLELELSEESEPEDVLRQLLQQLTPNAKTINEMIDEYDEVSINCFMRSDYGQMGFALSNEMLTKLAVLGVGMDFHILSFGMVE
ncbi:DUF4279 domain-containing protein [Paenibacillus sp. FSL K6-1217]|uniref:DUF4279 domain-containing protein n=1 Tax=Paenibacillus sp. FSL K6-1217 TaxID=2921466 RepID=UPI003245944B